MQPVNRVDLVNVKGDKMIDANIIEGSIRDLRYLSKKMVTDGYYFEGGMVLGVIYLLEEMREQYKEKDNGYR